MSSFHNSDPEVPDELPPPAYEFSQHEFDQKISHALEQSRVAVDEDGEWEVWDETAFAAAASRLAISNHTEGPSSSRSPPPLPQPPPPPPASSSTDNEQRTGSSIQPLRVVKKSRQPSLRKEKERPNWYAEAGLNDSSTSASVGPAQPAPVRQTAVNPTTSNYASPQPVFPEREMTPPPMFEPVGPSLDGPPYDGYGDSTAPQRPGLVMAYVPGESRPASPLYSPTSPPPSHMLLPPNLVQPVPERRSLPPPPPPGAPSPEPRILHQSSPPPPRPPVQRSSPRPITTSYRDNLKSKSYLPPRITFDPRVAYGGAERSAYHASEEMPPADIDPASFYTYVALAYEEKSTDE
jgi:hypothetical protein